jgi:hypothetical protein
MPQAPSLTQGSAYPVLAAAGDAGLSTSIAAVSIVPACPAVLLQMYECQAGLKYAARSNLQTDRRSSGAAKQAAAVCTVAAVCGVQCFALHRAQKGGTHEIP